MVQNMIRAAVAVIVLAGLALPAYAQAGDVRLIQTDYFENSRMSDPLQDQPMTKTLVHLSMESGAHCSGFFVKNSENRFLIATARHCAEYHFTEACQKGQIQIETQVGGFWGGFHGQCQSVIASDEEHDAVIFEAKFDTSDSKKILSKIGFANLSTQPVPLNTRLVTLGYPAGLRDQRATLTDNCWRNDGIDDQKFFTKEEIEESTDPTPSEECKASDYIHAHETMIAYNCDVYGGNSGGPVYIEGSDSVAVGMPAVYYPKVMRKMPKEASSWFIWLAPFIRANIKDIEGAGILIENTPIQPIPTMGT